MTYNVETKSVPLVITFQASINSFIYMKATLAFNDLMRQLLNKHKHILNKDQETKNVSAPGAMATLCSAHKLSNYMARAKLNPIQRFAFSHEYIDKRYEVCLNFQETSCFISLVTSEHIR